MVKARRIGHVTFETPDIEKAIDHYTGVIGLVVAAREGDRVYLATKLGQLAVELRRGSAARCVRISFEIAPDCDLADAARQLTAHGVTSDIASDPTPGIPKALAFEDPKGTTISLFTDWRSVTAPGQVLGAAPIKFGHIAFTVPDPRRIAEFYQQVLGFRVSDWIEDFFVFLRCNFDHHSINFIRGGNAVMHHYAFELHDFAHLQHACELLGQMRVPIIWGPVRLGPGHNVAIFHKNQDGQVVEFYAELDRMLDEELGYFEPRPWHRDRPQRPKVWSRQERSIWGPPPTDDFPKNFG